MIPPEKILFVESDPDVLAAFVAALGERFACDTAPTGAEAIARLQTCAPYAVIVVEMRMPGVSGVEVLEKFRELSPDTVRMAFSGAVDQQTAFDAVNRGHVFRFIEKSAPPGVLIPALEAGIERHRARRTERELLEGTLGGSIKLLTDVLGLATPDALSRGQHLRDSMARLARHVKAEPLWEIELAALLSSIGNAAIPPSVLRKIEAGAALRPEEARLRRSMPQIGHDLLADIPRLAGVARIVLYQNKNYDGTGFPDDPVAGEDMPVGSRLLRILNDRLDLEADGVVQRRAFDAMRARSGTYDPALLAQCFICFETFLVQAVSADRPVLTVSARHLAVGQVVVADIVTPEGMTLVSAGHRLTESTLRRVLNFAELGEVREPLLVQEAVLQTTAAMPVPKQVS